MNIENTHNSPLNYDPSLQPLFDAMKEGKRIKSITCMKGSMNEHKPELDITIEDFVATDYWVAIGSQGNKHFDYVDTDKRSFYMSHIRTFELY